MIIFQTAGGGDAGSFGFSGIFSDTGVPATTFRNNAYIHRLNRTLQAEMRAVSAYLAARGQLLQTEDDLVGSTVPIHQSSGKELINLIIYNRGIPEDRTAISIGLTKTFIKACSVIPEPVARKATLGTLSGIERQLISSYKKLRREAPRRDLQVIDQLIDAAEKSRSILERYRG